MKTRFAAIMLLLSSSLLRGQSTSPDFISVSYLGETITHYGGKVSADYLFGQRAAGPLKGNFVYASVNVSLYRHPKNHYGFIFHPEIGYRRLGRKGFFLEAALGPGILITRLDGKVYATDDSGNLKEKKLQGHTSAASWFAVGLGGSLSRRNETYWRLRPNIIVQKNFVRYSYPKVALEAGVVMRVNQPKDEN